MFAALNRLFSFLETLFGAAEKGAQAIHHIASVAEIKAGGYAQEEVLKLQASTRDLKKELALK